MNSPLVRVGDIATQLRGVSFSKADALTEPRDGHIPVMTASNITEDGLKLDSSLYISESRVAERQWLRPNDLVVTTSSGSLSVVGRAALVRGPLNATFGAFCKVLRPGDRVDADYLSHFFRTSAYRARVSKLAAGANINNLRNEDLDNLEIPLPPLPEQRRIASILDQADELRAKRRKSLALLGDLARTDFVRCLTEDLDAGSVTRPFGSLVESVQNGLYRPAADYGSGHPILRIADFSSGDILSLTGLSRVQIPAKEAARFSLKPGDLVVNRVNAMSHIGKAALVASVPERTVFESNMMRVSLDPSQVLPGFVLAWLQTQAARRQIRSSAKQAINQASINQDDLFALQLPVPSMKRQHQLVSRLETMRSVKAIHETDLVKLDELFASLQHRAFRGEL